MPPKMAPSFNVHVCSLCEMSSVWVAPPNPEVEIHLEVFCALGVHAQNKQIPKGRSNVWSVHGPIHGIEMRCASQLIFEHAQIVP